MKTLPQKMNCHSFGLSVVALMALCALSSSATAAPVAPSAFTDDGSRNLTSITISGVSYTNLTGATANVLKPASGGGLVGLWILNTNPELTTNDINAAASGLSYREGAANVLVNTTFQFGKVVVSTDKMFIFDVGTTASPGDAVTLALINSSGADVGDYSLSLTTASFSNVIVGTTNYSSVNASGTVGLGGAPVTSQSATSFALSDFIGTSGDLSTVTGFRISAGTTLDPTVVGLASVTNVPEPSSYALIISAMTACLVVTRRRSMRA